MALGESLAKPHSEGFEILGLRALASPCLAPVRPGASQSFFRIEANSRQTGYQQLARGVRERERLRHGRPPAGLWLDR